MIVNHKYTVALKNLIVLFLGLASIVLVYLTSDVLSHILIMILYSIFMMFIVKFDIFHPYVWYSGFFTLYSIGYPILVFYMDSIYNKDIIILQLIAIITFAVVVTPRKYKVTRDILKEIKLNIAKYIKPFLTIIIILTILELYMGSFSHKSELSTNTLLFSFGYRTTIVYLILYAIDLVNYYIKYEKIQWKSISTCFILMFLMFFYSGERDVVLRYIIITCYLIYFLKYSKTNKIVLTSIGALLLMVVPLLSRIKYFGMTGQVSDANENILISLVNSEFASASRNLQMLVSSGEHEGYYKGYTMIINFLRALPFSFGQSFSVTNWFSQTYYGRGGRGFSLVGEGYVNFGYFGVVLVFFVVGLIVRTLYKKSIKSQNNLFIYLFSITIFVYAIRADLANIFSPLIKHVLYSFLLLYILERIFFRSKFIKQ